MATSPEKWEAVKRLFEAALDEEPARRISFLAEHCSDAVVRAEVERLLSEHDEAGAFLSTPALDKVKVEGQATPSKQRLSGGELLAGRFRILRFIARGGMGEVYEAEDEELRERVAIKTIRPEILVQSNAIARFRREVHLARKVTHPNVCRVFDLFRHKPASGEASQEVVFISMELLHGRQLSNHLKDLGPLDAAEALGLIRQMASALTSAHAVGIVHRDFKPQNVMLVAARGQEGLRAVVTDFGIALQLDIDEVSFSTGPGLLGTPAYMSPEQMEGRPATPASDIYALGLVTYEMVTGNRPFQGDTPISAAMKRLSEAPIPPRKFKPELSPAWESVILRCLERDPANRFASAEDVVERLAKEDERHWMVKALPKNLAWRTSILTFAVLLTVAIGLGSEGWNWHVRSAGARLGSPKFHILPTGPNIAVIGFRNESGNANYDWLATELSESLTTDLAGSRGLHAIPAGEVASVKTELSLGQDQSLEHEDLSNVREALGADYLLLGRYAVVPPGPELDINVMLQDARGNTVASVHKNGSETEYRQLITGAASDALEKLGTARLSDTQVSELQNLYPSDEQAAQLYFQALDKLRTFDPTTAQVLLTKAL
jgi:serine/threonine protein kinase